LSEVQKKEKAKIEAYNNISITLRDISANADKAIPPKLAESLATEEECKRLIKENNEACENIWKNAVETFVGEVNSSVTGFLQNAFKNEAEIQAKKHKAVQENTLAPQKQQEYKISPMRVGRSVFHQDKADDSLDTARGHKRRRLSPSFSQDVRDINSDQDSLMKTMKMRLKEQALALVNLEKENNEASDKRRAGRWKLIHDS
jgi:hypothetical protein